MFLNTLLPMILGAVLFVISAIVLLKPENRRLKWPWVAGIIGLVMFILNGIRFLLY